MEEALEMARTKDTKERMAAVERLRELLEASRKTLSSSEVTSLVDCCLDLLKDNNFKVSQCALQTLASAAVISGEHLKLHYNGLIPAVVEKLGDGKQPVRDAARRFLLTLMEVSSPTIIVERAGSYAWKHKSWRIREEFARTVTSAISLFASTEIPLQRVLLSPVLQLLNDSNPSVREVSILCIEEMYAQVGPQFHDELQRHYLPASMAKEINARLDKIVTKVHASDGLTADFGTIDVKPASFAQKKSPRAKITSREAPFSGVEIDGTEKPVDPIKVFSDKELIREFEKIISNLVPERDWSIRITAMQRVEGLIGGGAADLPSFPSILKQLVSPLSTQLSDRRSSIVKQVCHLLNLLSKELLGDFEACAEIFIPVLFKLVVITVHVIAESADNCIKTMLRNCKVSRMLPRIVDCAKNDRSSVLRARCCEYALLILEYWADAPEILRSTELYEDLIKCCVSDAMSEVRSTARSCYRLFTKTWPERSRRLFSSFDPSVQRIINEEDGGIHRRYASPSLSHEGGFQSSYTQSRETLLSNKPGYGTSSIVSIDKTSSVSSSSTFSAGQLLSQTKALGRGNERSLESVLHASKEKVSAIESMLRGLDISEKNTPTTSTSLDLGVDPPSARDPPFPATVSVSNHNSSQCSFFPDPISSTNIVRNVILNGNSTSNDVTAPSLRYSKDISKVPLMNDLTSDTSSSLSLSYVAKQDRVYFENNSNARSARLIPTAHIDRHRTDIQYKDTGFRESHANYVPNFQRPLLRKTIPGRTLATGRNNADDSHYSSSDSLGFMDCPTSLAEALTEGLNPSSDWSSRVSAFNCLRTLLKQGPRGIQDVTQNFEKVMKLFFLHLDDPHHKVAQAALLALSELIPICRKPFESYLERILPHVFSRLIDPKESVRHPCSVTLQIVNKTYGIDSLLAALLRSLDEQRSLKAKLAVLDFAINSFNNHALNYDGSGNIGLLKLWLSKLAPLTRDKNTKLKESAINCIISVYSHFDSSAVLNFIVNLSVDEQNAMRRAIKRYTPRIEVDLVNLLQNKKERTRSKSFYDLSDAVGSSSEEGFVGTSKRSVLFGRYSAGSIDNDDGRKWSSMQDPGHLASYFDRQSSDETHEQFLQSLNASSLMEHVGYNNKDPRLNTSASMENPNSWSINLDDTDHGQDVGLTTTRQSNNGLLSSNQPGNIDMDLDSQRSPDEAMAHEGIMALHSSSLSNSAPSIPQLLHQICSGDDELSISSKAEAFQQLLQFSSMNDSSIWTKYFNQILTAALEVLSNSDHCIRELALSLIAEMLKNQKDKMEDSIEIVIEKLLDVTKDEVPKVSNEAYNCLSTVLTQYDTYRCLMIIGPLLVSEDEKTLVTCINCLTKLVNQLSQEELMEQLPSFLPSIFDAFGNQSADVRKTVVFCLVDIYIILGKAFLPYLEGLNSTQLKLVTIYANRISQARFGTPLDDSNA